MARFNLDDRVWYRGPGVDAVAALDWAPRESVWIRVPGSTGKVYHVTRDAVFVDWGGGFWAWVPRSHLATYNEWLAAGAREGYPGDELGPAEPKPGVRVSICHPDRSVLP